MNGLLDWLTYWERAMLADGEIHASDAFTAQMFTTELCGFLQFCTFVVFCVALRTLQCVVVRLSALN